MAYQPLCLAVVTGMLVQLRDKELDEWADRAETSPVRGLRSFAAGLRRDWDAVKAGLTRPHSIAIADRKADR